MKNNKALNSVIIGIILLLFSAFFGEEYYLFHKDNNEISKYSEQVIYENKQFEITNIEEIDGLELYYTPSIDFLESMVTIIDSAKNNVYIEVYMLTEQRVKDAVIRAYNRGVEIKILLEKDPYMAYNINNKAYDELEKKGISVKWSNTDNYALNHSKFLLIDDTAIVSTGNLTHSTFTSNRDLFLIIGDKQIVDDLYTLFSYDFDGIKKGVNNDNIVLSPINSRAKILKLFEKAEKDIKIHIPYFNDEEIVEKLIELKNEKNLEISAIIPDTAVEDENTIRLIRAGLKIYKIPKYTLHSKAILVDNTYLYVGSTNFSQNSLDNNRELGILTTEVDVIEEFNRIFELDIIE